MKHIPRKELLATLRERVARGTPFLLAGAGCGLSARAEEEAGADVFMAYNTGIYRMDGHVSLMGYRYYSDGNTDTLALGRTFSSAVKHTPVVGGVCCEDPTRDIPRFVGELMDAGFSGVTNVPSVAGASQKPGSVFTASTREYGLGFDAELQLIRHCVRQEIFTAMYAYDITQVQPMVEAGVDLIGIHAGGTTGGSTGSLGETPLTMEQAAELTRQGCELAVRANPQVLVAVHGGPFENPQAVEACFQSTPVHGYIGASGVERIPVEKKLAQVYAAYRELHLA